MCVIDHYSNQLQNKPPMIDDLLFLSMAPRMIMHVSLGSEAFLALIAYERPLIVVNPFVNP